MSGVRDDLCCRHPVMLLPPSALAASPAAWKPLLMALGCAAVRFEFWSTVTVFCSAVSELMTGGTHADRTAVSSEQLLTQPRPEDGFLLHPRGATGIYCRAKDFPPSNLCSGCPLPSYQLLRTKPTVTVPYHWFKNQFWN